MSANPAPNEYESQYNALREQLQSAISRGDEDEIIRIHNEAANLTASIAAKSGDRLTIHLLSAIEESHKERGHAGNTTAGLLLAMVFHRRMGLLDLFCDSVEPFVSQLMFMAKQELVHAIEEEEE